MEGTHKHTHISTHIDIHIHTHTHMWGRPCGLAGEEYWEALRTRALSVLKLRVT